MENVLISNVQRYKSSILQFNEVKTSEDCLQCKETMGSFLGLYNAIIDGKEGFAVTVAYWGGDDADVWHHIFWQKSDAVYCYNKYKYPDAGAEDEPIVKTAEFERDGVKRAMPYTSLYNGIYPVHEMHGGDYIRPYINSVLAQKYGLFDELRAMAKKDDDDIRNIIGTEYEKCLITVGENEDGSTMKVVANNEVAFRIHNCWETGLNYYELRGRYEKDVFDVMRPHLAWHGCEQEEEGDWRGWYTLNIDRINKALETIGKTTTTFFLG